MNTATGTNVNYNKKKFKFSGQTITAEKKTVKHRS